MSSTINLNHDSVFVLLVAQYPATEKSLFVYYSCRFCLLRPSPIRQSADHMRATQGLMLLWQKYAVLLMNCSLRQGRLAWDVKAAEITA